MKKKMPFIWIAVIVVVVALLGLIAYRMFTGEEAKADVARELFRVQTYENLKAVSDQNEITVEQTEAGYVVRGVKTFGETMSFAFLFDANGSLLESTTYCELDADTKDAIKGKIDTVLSEFAKMFDAEASQYYIYSSTEVYDCKDDASFENVFSGAATVEFRVRDKKNSYWVAQIRKTGTDQFLYTIEHYLNQSQYEDIPVNIDLS